MNKAFFIMLIMVSQCCGAAVIDTSHLVVETKQGKVRGTTEKDVCVWRGIRYAKAPAGALRFKAPQPPDSWKDIKNATEYGAVAPQIKRILVNDEEQSEDCLSLNIWSPAADGKKRPVMFWIHGGGFVGGSGSGSLYNGAQLSKNGDLVVVSINYRIGPLGFLYFKDLPANKGEFESNLGIRDQVAALKWVRDNIAAFGGDPETVTIFGESAGGISVQTLMAVPSAKGLFKRAIAESGPPGDTWSPASATCITLRFLKILGVSPDSLYKLKTTPVDSLNSALVKLLLIAKGEPTMEKTFAPTVDGDFLPKDIISAVSAGQCRGIDLLIGTNKDEANLFAMSKLEMAPTNKKQLAPYLARFDTAVTHRIISSYSNYPHKAGILSLLTDGIFTVPCIRFAESQCTYSSTYMYRFDWSSGLLKLAGIKACHGLEIPFVFGTFDSPLGKKVLWLADKKRVLQLSAQIQQAWINFARTGNPNATGTDAWKKYDVQARNTIIYDKKSYFTSDPKGEQRKAWGSLNIFE